MKIYTKTGDKGLTSLFTGKRVRKSSLRVQSYGEVDELNSWLGLIHTNLPYSDIKTNLENIQNQLFDLGADLATPPGEGQGKRAKEVPRISSEMINQLEELIDLYESELTPLQHFILPGGTILASYFHLARCVCRRAERTIVDLMFKERLDPAIVKYLNRLSDLLFVLARVTNHREDKKEPIWQPKAPHIS